MAHSKIVDLTRIRLSRRSIIGAGAAALVAPRVLAKTGAPNAAANRFGPLAKGEIESHGLSTFGDLSEPADFKHFGYVNPKAPKGGTLALSPASPTYDSFNAYILRGNPATGMSL
ncbi:MAG: ABC transporter substrate-binding protein, partial [Methylocystis sp.]